MDSLFLGNISLMSAAAFAGTALYVSLVEHPARLTLDDKGLLAQWKPSYSYGKVMQASLALISGLVGLIVAWQSNDWRWYLGAALVLANWPFTLLVIAPTNNQLNAIAETDAGPRSRALLQKWGHLHSVRTCLGIGATLIYLGALSGG